MSEERYKQIKDSIELQNLVKTQLGIDDELLQEEIELLNAYEQLQQENKQLKLMLKSKPDNEITLQDDKGTKYTVIQTERIDMQEKLNKTIQELLSNWNKLKELIDIKLYNTEYLQKLCSYKIDEETHMILDIIKKEMQEIESGNSDDKD